MRNLCNCKKKYVEMMKGEFRVSSKINSGATMTFTVPGLIEADVQKIEESKEYERSMKEGNGFHNIFMLNCDG
jgi:hypothetical protein